MNVQEEPLEEPKDPALTAGNLGKLFERASDAQVRVSGFRVLTGGCRNRVVAARPDRDSTPVRVAS